MTVVSDRIARDFDRSEPIQAVAFDTSKAFDRVWHPVLLQVRYIALFLLFSVIDDTNFFWMVTLHMNIQLMLEFFKAPFSALHFYYYTLMTFLIMLFVVLLTMLKILLSTLSVIRHLIRGNN